MKVDESVNAIRVVFYIGNAMNLLQQLIRVVHDVVEKKFLSLQYEILTPVDEDCTLDVRSLQKHVMEHPTEPLTVLRSDISVRDIHRRFSALLPAVAIAQMYHVFVSYRHGRDSEYTAHFVNALSKLPTGHAGNHLVVFYDCFSLEDGQQFDNSFMEGLAHSSVVVPFVSPDTLTRMCDFAALERVDHVLLEWWLAITLYKDPGSRLNV